MGVPQLLPVLVEEFVVGGGRRWWGPRCEGLSLVAEDEGDDGRVDLNFWRERSERFHSDFLSSRFVCDL